MAQRTCDVEGCDRPHRGRGLCAMHWKREHGNPTRYPCTCVTCGTEYGSARRTGRFCSDQCKGDYYRATRATKCKLPADHPVMVLIAEARKPKPKRDPNEWRAARECPTCGAEFCPLYTSITVACSSRCKKKMARRRRRAREHNTLNDWRWSDFMRVAKRFGYCCAYCGDKPDRLDPDHVMPLSRGGADSIANILPTCAACNSDKAAHTLSEWAVRREAQGKPPRATSWSPGDPRYVHLTHVVLAA